MQDFFKKHLAGIFIFSVLASITGSLILNFFPLPNKKNFESIRGIEVISSFGKHYVNYGVKFKSPPKLSFPTTDNEVKYGGITNPSNFRVISRTTTGFIYFIGDGSFTLGTTFVWEANGVIE